MSNVGNTTIALYALILFLGGIIGYAQAHSTVSLVTGIISGLVLAYLFTVARQGNRMGLTFSFVIATAWAAFFLSDYIKAHKAMPAGFMLAISAICAVVMLIALVQGPAAPEASAPPAP